MTISSVYPSSSFFYNEFSFLGETALDVRIEERERERERERKVEVAYTLQIHKSPCTTACLYAYIPFFFPFSFLLSSSFFSRGKQDSTVSQLGSGEEKTKNQRGGTKSRREEVLGEGACR